VVFALSERMKIESMIFISKAKRNNLWVIFIGHRQSVYHGPVGDRFDFGFIGNFFVFSSHFSGLGAFILNN
jgi:hypothetical protein